MFVQILSWIHNITTMLFGIYISSFFLGVKQNKYNVIKLAVFSCIEGTFYMVVMSILGDSLANQIYLFLIHIPLIIFLYVYYILFSLKVKYFYLVNISMHVLYRCNEIIVHPLKDTLFYMRASHLPKFSLRLRYVPKTL